MTTTLEGFFMSPAIPWDFSGFQQRSSPAADMLGGSGPAPSSCAAKLQVSPPAKHRHEQAPSSCVLSSTWGCTGRRFVVLCTERYLMPALTEGLYQSRFLGCGKTLAGRAPLAPSLLHQVNAASGRQGLAQVFKWLLQTDVIDLSLHISFLRLQ